jgi:hypothetical protein
MSDHNERACTKCGSLLHHENDCSDTPRTDFCIQNHQFKLGSKPLADLSRTLERELAQARKDYDNEKAIRKYYQNIVYESTCILDVAFGRSVRKGTSIHTGNAKEQLKEVQENLKYLVEERDQLRQSLADALGREKYLTEAFYNMANNGADSMEGADAIEFKVAEEIMCQGIDLLKMVGINYDPISGRKETVKTTFLTLEELRTWPCGCQKTRRNAIESGVSAFDAEELLCPRCQRIEEMEKGTK